ncbi:MAG: hypothetical protein ACK55Q_21280 [Dolichospermum sp.]|jgi:hypothetical protein
MNYESFNYDTTWTGDEELDLSYLLKLRKAIDTILKLEDQDTPETVLHDAKTNLKRKIKGVALDFNINREFIENYIKIKSELK